MLKRLTVILLMLASSASAAEMLTFKDDMLRALVSRVPEILQSQDKATGRFGTGVFIVTDQNVVFPLAVAWATQHPENTYFHNPELLEAIMAGGDALIDVQDSRGMFVFRKKDDSTWGDIYMPWTYSRWVRAYGLIKDAMPPDRREKWHKALTLGYEGIADKELHRVHNIPAHHAMGLYCAGVAMDRPEWRKQATEFLVNNLVAEQDQGGFWSENQGPVVGYNFVYSDALGAYYALSGDDAVLPALKRAALFHANFTYPDGSRVETVDERNVYSDSVSMPNVGFTFTPEGRGWIAHQRSLLKGKPVGPDIAASYVLYGEEGEALPTAAAKEEHQFVLGKNDAMIRRRGPWFFCLSAYTADVPNNRWIQDRQSFVSLFHDKTGVILGGGNTKLQPLWSTFTVGDASLLKITGEDEPNFLPPKGIVHVPRDAELDPTSATLHLDYAGVKCHVRIDVTDASSAKLVYWLDSPPAQDVAAHVTLLPRMGKAWKIAAGKKGTLDEQPMQFAAGEAGEWFELDGYRVSLPAQASLTWPVLPHNPYRKGGHAETGEGRIVITLPFSQDVREHELVVHVQ